MDFLTPLLTGAALSASLIVAIGAQNAYLLRQGLRGEHVGVVVALCAGLDIVLMSLGVGGVAQAARLNPGLMQAIAFGGAAFLLGYAISAARRALRPSALAASASAPKPRGQVVRETLAVTLLNPHVYLDTVLLVGAVGAQQSRPAWFLAGASAASVAWFCGLGWGARALQPLFARPAAWRVLDGLIALVMATLGTALLVGALDGSLPGTLPRAG
jgi:L-lysine exporter family protein LysE/ArgO